MWDSGPKNRDPMRRISPRQGGFRYVGFDPLKLGSNVRDVTDNLVGAFLDHFNIQEEALPELIAAQSLGAALEGPVIGLDLESRLKVTEIKAVPQTPLEIMLGDPMELTALYEEAPASA